MNNKPGKLYQYTGNDGIACYKYDVLWKPRQKIIQNDIFILLKIGLCSNNEKYYVYRILLGNNICLFYESVKSPWEFLLLS